MEDDLREVSAGRGGVQDRELELLVRSYDEESPGGERNASSVDLVRVEHAELDGELALRVGDDRNLEPTGAEVGAVAFDVLRRT